MGARLFAAVVPPDEVVSDLERFMSPRWDVREQGSARLRWTTPASWHITTAFYDSVDDDRYEPLRDALAAIAARLPASVISIEGAGAFPSPERAQVLWLGLSDPAGLLPRLAEGSRTAGHRVGVPADGTRFVPHLTMARVSGRIESTRWLRVLATYASASWTCAELCLVESHLADRRPHRYEIRERFPLQG